MSGFSMKAYSSVAVETGVASADPHQLILMLYDGALEAIRLAHGHLQSGNITEKCRLLGKAVRIVDEGLKAAVDRRAGGQLSFRLLDLYDYATMRLLQANLRNDQAALIEVARLLRDLRAAWSQIRPAPAAPAVTAPPPMVLGPFATLA